MPSPLSSCSRGSRNSCWPRAAGSRRGYFVVCLALSLIALLVPGCKRLRHTDTRPLDQAGMWFGSIEELRKLDVTDAEVVELVKTRQAGVSDAACIELVRIARGHKQPFSSGDAVAGLRSVGVSEPTVLELARLDQLGLWAGEAQAMRLAGLSDQVLLAVARRRAAGQPAPSGSELVKLKDSGMGEAEILDLVNRGITDPQIEAWLEARRRAAASAGFVRYHRRRRR